MSFDPVSYAMGAKNSGGGGSSGSGVLVVTSNNGTLNKTWQELADSTVPIFVFEDSGQDEAINKTWYPAMSIAYDPDDGYWVGVMTDRQMVYFVCENATDYPIKENAGLEIPDNGSQS